MREDEVNHLKNELRHQVPSECDWERRFRDFQDRYRREVDGYEHELHRKDEVCVYSADYN